MAYIRIPFANAGDRNEVPAESVDGAISFTTGYGPRYSEDPDTSATARRIQRINFNGLMFRAFFELQQYQQFGVPEYILPADNNAVPFPYSTGALVRYNPTDGTTSGPGTLVYRSLVDNNTELPTVAANWLDTSTYTTTANSITSIVTNAGLADSVLNSEVTLSLDINGIPTTTTIANNHFLPFSTGVANQKTTIQNFLDTFITGAFISGLAGVDADTLGGIAPAGFVTAARAINTDATSGLSGGGDLSTDRSLALDIDNLTTVTAQGTNEIAFSTGPGSTNKSTIDDFIAQFVTGSFISGLTGVDADTLGGNPPAPTSAANSIVQRNSDGDGQFASVIVDNTTAVTASFVLTSGVGSSEMSRRTLANFKTDLGVQNLTGNTFTGDFTSTGRITGTVGVTSLSDQKLKQEIGVLDPEDSLNAVLAWRKVYTRFSDEAAELINIGREMQVSFYAQDVKETHPPMVSPIRDAQGRPTEYNTLAYDRTPVVLASAMEALVSRLDALEDELEALRESLAGGR